MPNRDAAGATPGAGFAPRHPGWQLEARRQPRVQRNGHPEGATPWTESGLQALRAISRPPPGRIGRGRVTGYFAAFGPDPAAQRVGPLRRRSLLRFGLVERGLPTTECRAICRCREPPAGVVLAKMKRGRAPSRTDRGGGTTSTVLLHLGKYNSGGVAERDGGRAPHVAMDSPIPRDVDHWSDCTAARGATAVVAQAEGRDTPQVRLSGGPRKTP